MPLQPHKDHKNYIFMTCTYGSQPVSWAPWCWSPALSLLSVRHCQAAPRCPACQQQAQRKRIVCVSSSHIATVKEKKWCQRFPLIYCQMCTHTLNTLTETLHHNAQLTMVVNLRLSCSWPSTLHSLSSLLRMHHESSRQRPLSVIYLLIVC